MRETTQAEGIQLLEQSADFIWQTRPRKWKTS